MAKAYKGLMNVCPEASEKAIYRLATYYFDTKKYEEAIPVYTTFLELSPSDTNAADDAEVKLFRAKAFLHPVDFKPVLVKGLSTPDPEYLLLSLPIMNYVFLHGGLNTKVKTCLPQPV